MLLVDRMIDPVDFETPQLHPRLGRLPSARGCGSPGVSSTCLEIDPWLASGDTPYTADA